MPIPCPGSLPLSEPWRQNQPSPIRAGSYHVSWMSDDLKLACPQSCMSSVPSRRVRRHDRAYTYSSTPTTTTTYSTPCELPYPKSNTYTPTSPPSTNTTQTAHFCILTPTVPLRPSFLHLPSHLLLPTPNALSRLASCVPDDLHSVLPEPSAVTS
jgi:hypothetical protein